MLCVAFYFLKDNIIPEINAQVYSHNSTKLRGGNV